jgi:hypothetical protein
MIQIHRRFSGQITRSLAQFFGRASLTAEKNADKSPQNLREKMTFQTPVNQLQSPRNAVN